MFKTLLRTLPSLSGNVALNCNVNEVSQINKDSFECFIRHASLIPLQNKYYDKVINVSLLDGRWEHDVKRFYKYYANYFYDENFPFNETDYQKLDLTASVQQEPRNKDYEFGCKRGLCSSTGYQFIFYAPFYIDDVDSIPDNFTIDIKFDNGVHKSVRINIGNYKKSLKNYLYVYLKRYVEQIDDNVVYCLWESNQGTYFGLDAKRGGLVQVKDNVVGALYNRQMTMNNFDWTICDGFKRNALIMRQIIPLCFSFNVNDLLNKQERKYTWGARADITGRYEFNSKAEDFYDFTIDYSDFKVSQQKYVGHDDKETFLSTNIMDIGFPSMREGKFHKYKYTNKVTPKYTRWKLKYSSDKNPYITNISWAFSYINKTSNYQYGEFPLYANSLIPYAKMDAANLTNLLLSAGDKDTDYVNSLNNHICDWFTTMPKDGTVEDMTEKDVWCDVKDGQAYYKGILYNLNSFCNTFEPEKRPDKFGVFVRPNLTTMTQLDAETLQEADIIMSYSSMGASDADIYSNVSFYDNGRRTEFFDLTDEGFNTPVIVTNGELIESVPKERVSDYIDIKNGISYFPNSVLTYINLTGMSYNAYTAQMLRDHILATGHGSADTFAGITYAYINVMYDSGSDLGASLYSYYQTTYQQYVSEFEEVYERIPDYYEWNKFYSVDELLRSIGFITQDVGEAIDEYSVTSYERLPFGYNSNIIRYDEEGNVKCTLFEYVRNNHDLGDEYDEVNYFPIGENVDYLSYDPYMYCSNYESEDFEDLTVAYTGISLDNDSETGTVKYSFFVRRKMISSYCLENISEKYGITIPELTEYSYVPKYADNGRVDLRYFEKSPTNALDGISTSEYGFDRTDKYVFVDGYSLKAFINSYNGLHGTDIAFADVSEKPVTAYAHVINADHIENYRKELCQDADGKLVVPNATEENVIMKHIYRRRRVVVIDELTKDISLKDFYSPVGGSYKEFLESGETDVYIKKTFYMLNDTLYGIMAGDGSELTPMFLYTFDDDVESVSETFPVVNAANLSSGAQDAGTALRPLMTTVWKTEEAVTNIKNLVMSGNLVSKNGYWQYQDINYDVYMQVNTENISVDGTYYKKSVATDTELASIVENGLTYYKNYGMYVKTTDSHIYAMYIVDVDFSNTKYSINMDNGLALLFDTVDGKPYNDRMFRWLVPYLTTNLFSEFTLLAESTMVKPHTFTIDVKYQPIIYDAGNTTDSYKYEIFNDTADTNTYDIKFVNSSKSKLQLNRYMNRITPLIVRTDLIRGRYSLKFKFNDNTIDENNIFKTVLNPNIYQPLYVVTDYDTVNHKENSHVTVEQYEWKHFNHNELFNLEESFSYTVPSLLIYEDVLAAESFDRTFEVFKKHINKYGIVGDDHGKFLFLLNRYKVNYISEPVKTSSYGTHKLYSLTYKFTLS